VGQDDEVWTIYSNEIWSAMWGKRNTHQRRYTENIAYGHSFVRHLFVTRLKSVTRDVCHQTALHVIAVLIRYNLGLRRQY